MEDEFLRSPMQYEFMSLEDRLTIQSEVREFLKTCAHHRSPEEILVFANGFFRKIDVTIDIGRLMVAVAILGDCKSSDVLAAFLLMKKELSHIFLQGSSPYRAAT